MGLLVVADWVSSSGSAEFLLAQPRYWVYPLQTLICGGLLWRFFRGYGLRVPKEMGGALAVGVLVFGIWICPQVLLGFPARVSGFDPEVFAPGSALYWGTLALRFLRLVIVVPLLEEIFWRGFLLRYLIHEDFQRVAFGAFTWRSFLIVSVFFALAHYGPDFWPALATGALYNGLAIRTRSLSACVLAHATTNLLLGVYIMATRQWGFW